MIRLYYWVCCSLRPVSAKPHPPSPPANAPVQHYSSTFSLIGLLYSLLYLLLYLRLVTPTLDLTWLLKKCSHSTSPIFFLSFYLDGDWMYVGGTAGGRRERRKVSDENANSFLVKEGVVQDFSPGGRETAAYGLVQTL